MSLINNALKEAESARPNNIEPAAGPQFLAVDCPPPSGRSNAALVVLIAVVMTLSGVMMWKWFRAGGELKVRARSYDSAVNPVSAPTPAPSPELSPKTASLETSSGEAAVASPHAGGEQNPASEATTNLAAVVSEPPKLQVFTYKLQGIVYQPGHSSAVINGKTVVAGEHVGDSRVAKVGLDYVELVNPAGQTNLLELP